MTQNVDERNVKRGRFKSHSKPWTTEEIVYLTEKFADTPIEELALALNRTRTSVQTKAYSMGLRSSRNWTQEQDELLKGMWGKFSYKSIVNRTGRTLNGVKLRAKRLGLGDPRQYTVDISVNEFSKLIGREYSVVKNWHKSRGLPIVYKNVSLNQKGAYLRLKDFWLWFEQNKGALDLRKIEPNSLGPEPDWVKEKRRADFYNKNKPNFVLWTEQEDRTLIQLLEEGKSYNEMSRALNRSQGAIKRRIQDNGLPHPTRIDNHIEYSEEEIQRIVKMNRDGYSFEHIAQVIGPHRSASGCRGKLERMGYKFRRGTAYLPEENS